jgi:hypothetical protein
MSAYLLGNIIFIVAWIVLYFARPQTRKVQIFGSLLLLPFALLDIWFRPIYWHPPLLIKAIEPLSIETLLYCFTAGGIAIVFGDLFIKKARDFKIKWLNLIYFFMASFALYFIFRAIFRLPEMNNLNFSFLLIWLLLIIWDSNDMKENYKSFLPGLIFALFTIVAINIALIFYPHFVEKYWNLQNLWPLFFNTPTEEIFFAGILGALWAILPKYLLRSKTIG